MTKAEQKGISIMALSWWEQWHCELCLTALSSEEEKTLSSDRVIISRLAKCSHCQRKIQTDQYYIYFRLKIVMTASQINDTFGFQSGVKVKVVGEVSGKWNLPNLMYIFYHKQIMQKIQWNSWNGQLHLFPIDSLCKAMQTQTLKRLWPHNA